MNSSTLKENAVKPITIQKVRSVLKKAGFPASKSYPTRIPGWHRNAPGSYVRKRLGEGFVIEWTGMDHWMKEETSKKERRAKVEAMRQALLDAGIVAVLETNQWDQEHLTVKACPT